MAVGTRNLKLTQRDRPAAHVAGGAGAEPLQLSLHFSPSKPMSVPASSKPSRLEMVKGLPNVRLGSMDQRLSTRDVVLIVGVNRSTIFRWTKAGQFPQKHKSGGWLRSDIENWLAEHADEEEFAE